MLILSKFRINLLVIEMSYELTWMFTKLIILQGYKLIHISNHYFSFL